MRNVLGLPPQTPFCFLFANEGDKQRVKKKILGGRRPIGIIDMGPEGGDGGGQMVAEGTPEQVAEVEASHTGRFLREILVNVEC